MVVTSLCKDKNRLQQKQVYWYTDHTTKFESRDYGSVVDSLPMELHCSHVQPQLVYKIPLDTLKRMA